MGAVAFFSSVACITFAIDHMTYSALNCETVTVDRRLYFPL
jgi:hypothetical protein